MLPSQRETAPDIPARLVFLQCAHLPVEAVCARPVRTCLALTKNSLALSRSLKESPLPFIRMASSNSSLAKGVIPIA